MGKLHSCPWHRILEMPFWCRHSSVMPGDRPWEWHWAWNAYITEEMYRFCICESDIGIPQSRNVRTELPTNHRHLNERDGCVKKLWGSSQDESLSCTTMSKMTVGVCLLTVPSYNLSVLWVEGSQITLASLCHMHAALCSGMKWRQIALLKLC